MSSTQSLDNGQQATHILLIERIFAADGALDIDAFLTLLAPDVQMRLGSQPPLRGREEVRQLVSGLFSMMQTGLDHRLFDVWSDKDTVVYEAEVLYPLKDGRDLTLPYTNILRLDDDGLVRDYRIYVDLSPLQATASQASPSKSGE